MCSLPCGALTWFLSFLCLLFLKFLEDILEFNFLYRVENKAG